MYYDRSSIMLVGFLLLPFRICVASTASSVAAAAGITAADSSPRLLSSFSFCSSSPPVWWVMWLSCYP